MKLRNFLATILLSALLMLSAPWAAALDFGLDLGLDCANLSENLAGAAGCDTSGRVIDFTEYEGGFDSPDSAGYDEALTRNDNLRDFIQTIVNFALGFLGLLATIIIIYGGVMYVASRGDEEMATKGKKTITYAVIGILIILGSFALVNTLISAGGGSTTGGTVAGGGTGETITSAGGSFDVNGVVREIENTTSEYLDAYETLVSVSSEVFFLKSIEPPQIIDVEEKDQTLGGYIEFGLEFIEGSDDDGKLADEYQLIDERDIDEYIDDMREGARRIQRQVDSLSETYQAAQLLFDYLRSGVKPTSFNPFRSIGEKIFPSVHADEFDGDLSTISKGLECPENGRDDDQYRGISLGVTIYNTSTRDFGGVICKRLEDIELAIEHDYENKVSELIADFGVLEGLFDTEGGELDGSSLSAVHTAFANSIDMLTDAEARVNVNTASEVLQSMNDLNVLVQNLDFVSVQMSASVTRGSAPLIVRFDALGTLDPSGQTVTNEQISWDTNGDDTFTWENAPASIESGDGNVEGATATKRYDTPGTYLARVRVTSSSPNIAPGLALIPIIVEPAKSTIVLKANIGGEIKEIANFASRPIIDRGSLKVTEAEAKNGIEFDLTGSEDGSGSLLSSVDWDFGDSETLSGPWAQDQNFKPTHLYGRPGTYNVSVTVTDSLGTKDKKYFTLYVASPAARISHTPKSGPVGQAFSFDGGASSTDIGTISSYQWTITDSAGGQISESGSNFNRAFQDPGVYTVTLQIEDGSGDIDSTSVEILVESQAPVVSFDYEVLNPQNPGTIMFDASDTFDPDQNDTLTLTWEIDAVSGVDYRFIEQSADGEELTVQFLNTGDYDVTLVAQDDHVGDLQQSSSFTRNVLIDSVLDVDLEVSGDAARHLGENGETTVSFVAKSQNATAFEIDFNDGSSDFTESLTAASANFTHTYDKSGIFYVTLTALDDDNNRNLITRRVYISEADSPIAVLEVTSNGEDIGFGDSLTGNVNTRFTFDASNSINTDGSNNDLDYSWNFGDGTTSNQSSATHTYDEHAIFTVTLTVSDKEDATIKSDSVVEINIIDLPPRIRSISAIPDSFETPAKVSISVDAVDEDGDIAFVKGWYYDVDNSAKELGTVIAQSLNFSLTVNTNGEEDEEHEYGFAAEVTDSDNNVVSSFDSLSDSPTLTFTNGPNESPVAAFSVDRNSIYLGDEIIFSSSSYDPDGEILFHWWDLEGDGFFNNDAEEGNSFAFVPTQVATDGIDVQLKVEDDSGATATSDTVRIFVDAISEAPEARFFADVDSTVVTFRNNSFIDEENGAELQGVYWDFDLSKDTNGNGVPDDDLDSLEDVDSHDYEALGNYEVKLTVVDSTGQEDTLVQEIAVMEAEDPEADFSYTVEDLTAIFKDTSFTDPVIEVREWEWDFNEDGVIDSHEEDPRYTYLDYDAFEVKLTIRDDIGQEDSVIKTVELNDPDQPITAVLTSIPSPNDQNQVILEGNEGEVTFYFSVEGGSGRANYTIDKNIFLDGIDDDGIRDNDLDYSSSIAGSWRTSFSNLFGPTVVKLTVTDPETGESDVTTLQLVFDSDLGAASLFSVTPNEMLFFILAALITAIFGITIAMRPMYSK
ncbi:PKD domain-containing protein [Candidatus Peregrinibacteria bacterium]|nr:PKD domain-containing protein [Candidatus Peregrinibacteria bacterium]